jgi:starch synthase (maltosyl-transferring)
MRPNFFVNTQDILTEYLQHGGPAAFTIRAVLAATLSPTWGVYSGFELYEHIAIRPGSEEYLDSEKYQLRPRDFVGARTDGRSLAPLITQLNTIRREHSSLHWLSNLTLHTTDNDAIMCYSKRDSATGDTIIVVCSTDPHHRREGWVSLNLEALGVGWTSRFRGRDLLSEDDVFDWGEHNFVRLDPDRPAHILLVE